jgi:UDP-N-acetylglucosamine transferase subunit ALG13
MAQPRKLGRLRSAPERGERVDVLLVCEPGGHLLDLLGLHRAWRPFTHAWVTLDSVDTRSLLSRERVFFASGPTPRSVRKLLINLLIAWRTLRRVRPAVILTTGSALAVPFVWVGRALGVRTVYVECGGRADRPSLTCRLVAPVASLIYVQWPELERVVRRARYAGRVHISCAAELMLGAPIARPQNVSVFATVGTSKYPFDRLIRALDRLPDAEGVVVQRGVSRVRPMRAIGIDFLPFDELTAHIRQARVVVTHGGIGSVGLALANGKRPIVVPRLPALGEHVDDHQSAFARGMAAEGLVTLLDDPERLAELLAAPPCPPRARSAADGEDRLADELFAYLDAFIT